MLKLAYCCLLVSVITFIAGIAVYTGAVGGRVIVFGTPPGLIVASVCVLLALTTGLCGIILSILHARAAKYAASAVICLCFNVAYVISVALLVSAGLFLQSQQRDRGAELQAKYLAQERDEGVTTAKREIDGYLIASLKQGVVLMPMHTFKPLTNRSLGNGMKIVGIYLPASGDETRDRERTIIHGGLRNAVQTLLGYLVKQDRIADAVILLDAMEEASVSAYRKEGSTFLWTKDLRKELTSGSFKAANYAHLLDGHKVVAGFLAAQP